MNVDLLTSRLQEIESAIVSTTSQLHALTGHKTETQYWINQMQSANEPQVEEVLECPVETVVE